MTTVPVLVVNYGIFWAFYMLMYAVVAFPVGLLVGRTMHAGHVPAVLTLLAILGVAFVVQLALGVEPAGAFAVLALAAVTLPLGYALVRLAR
jgi:hypothetical protein